MTANTFSRSIGSRSGVQLNPIRDNTDSPAISVADQSFATVGRFVRGRIDKAFAVTKGNQARMLGNAGSIAASALNESRVQIAEALNAGANSVVVARLHPAASVLSLILVKASAVAAEVLTTGASLPAGSLFSLKHLECFSDGLTVEVNAVEVLDDADAQQASKLIKLRLRDPVSKELLFPEFLGSLDPTAKDDFQNSLYLPDVVSATTDLVEISVLAGASVPITSAFYGTEASGADKFVASTLTYFSEGGTTYSATDLDAACKLIQRSANRIGFVSAGGTQSQQLITKLIALGYQINKQVRWSIPGSMTPAQAKIFYDSVGGTDSLYSQCFWAPLLSDDPLNGGKAYIGTESLNIALACARNARMDANGVAAKNYPVAGSDFPLPRSGIAQKYDPEEDELKLLATTRINPVLFIDYASGGKYVFVDSLTGAKTEADRKLIAVADMATSWDDEVARYGQECLQKPMDIAIRMMTDFLATRLSNLETAKWLIPSAELGNRAYVANVTRNTQHPNQWMNVGYWVRYDGTNRAMFIEQTLSK